jgi:hypothetical protein
MQQERSEEQAKLLDLNKRFLNEVERGASWEEVRLILDDMRALVRGIDMLAPATVISMDNYPLENKSSESAQG